MPSYQTLRTLLFVHHSSDLYGSDKSLFNLVTGLDKKKIRIIIALPSEGPLAQLLRSHGFEVHIVAIACLARSLLRPKKALSLLRAFLLSLRQFDDLFQNKNIDLVYSNSIATLSGAFWAKKNKIPHLWHIREIILSPRISYKIFGFLLTHYADHIICNSKATKEALLLYRKKLGSKISIIWNGQTPSKPSTPDEIQSLKENISLHEDQILITLVGRINAWKGQSLLIEACEILHRKNISNFKLLIVGSPPPQQEHYLEKLKARIETSEIKDLIYLKGYQEDIHHIWNASDIAVVPSTEPEPFGLVAIEAMSASKAVIAANHGGLTEIVKNNITGFLFPPRNPDALANYLEKLIKDKNLRSQMGEQGKHRFDQEFIIDQYIQRITSIIHNTVNSRDSQISNKALSDK